MCGHACLDRLLGAILASDRRISFVSTFLGTDRADDATQPVRFQAFVVCLPNPDTLCVTRLLNRELVTCN